MKLSPLVAPEVAILTTSDLTNGENLIKMIKRPFLVYFIITCYGYAYKILLEMFVFFDKF